MTTRTAYHHGNLRAALVDAGIGLAREHGPAGVVLRAVAREVGVSHNAAYRHFADRDALLAAIAERAMESLVAAMQRRVAEVDEPDPVLAARLRLRGIERGYVDFALTEPGMFRVVFAAPPEVAMPAGGGAGVSADAGDAGDAPALDPFGVLNAALDDLVEVGFLPPERRPGAEVLCWSAVHGFASLLTDGPLVGTPAEERDAWLDAALASVDRGLGAPEPA